MYIGEQIINPTPERLRLAAQFGVERVVGSIEGLERFSAFALGYTKGLLQVA